MVTSLLRLLRVDGYHAEGCTSRCEGRRRLSEGSYRAVLLDRGFPDGDGLDLCRELRARKDPTPILILSARGHDTDVVEGLEAGADDYVVKPIAWAVLRARMKAILRRGSHLDRIVVGRIAIDPAERILTVKAPNGEPHHAILSPTELRMLMCLAEAPKRVFGRNALLDVLWGPESEVSANALDVLVTRVRRKLGPYARALVTVRGRGVTLDADV